MRTIWVSKVTGRATYEMPSDPNRWDKYLEATPIVVKLELLRGACQNHKVPTKSQIAKSIKNFIHELENPK